MTTVASDTSVASDRATRFRQRAVVSIASSDISMPTAERLNIYAKRRRMIVVGDAMFKAGSLSSVAAETVDAIIISVRCCRICRRVAVSATSARDSASAFTHTIYREREREREREIKACWLFLKFRLIRRMIGLIIYKYRLRITRKEGSF